MSIEVKIAVAKDIENILELRMEFVKIIGEGKKEIEFEDFEDKTREYYLKSLRDNTQVTCLAYVDGELAGGGTLCFLHVLPTLDHPTGCRGHLMNIYVRKEKRRNHVGTEMLKTLFREGRKAGVTEISLDATEDGRKLYEQYGFEVAEEAMVMNLS